MTICLSHFNPLSYNKALGMQIAYPGVKIKELKNTTIAAPIG